MRKLVCVTISILLILSILASLRACVTVSYGGTCTAYYEGSSSPTYYVLFNEYGLPYGVQWWVDLNGDNRSSASSVISFSEPNGTYTYNTGASGYIVFPSSGPITVNGADVNQTIAFTQGLPSTITIIPCSRTLALVSDASTPGPSETIGYANVTGDLWNIASNSVGNVTMTINQQGGLTTSVGFSNASTGSNPANIVGYPHVVYGYSPWTEAKTTMSKALQLPIQLGDFPQFVSLANYSISLDSDSTPIPINFAYDIWITQNESSSGCGVGDLELMIWTYNTDNLPGGGGGTFIASKQLPVYLNGSTQPVTWNVFVRDGNQSSGSFTTVYIVSNDPIGSGAVGIDMHTMIGEMIDALLVNYPGNWSNASLQNYWIEDIELGCEFGLLQSQATCSWNLNNYCYFLNYLPLANEASSFTYSNSQSTSTTGTTTINSGSASLNQLPATDISVSITGSSAQDGTNITVTSTDYGATQPSGTGTLQVNGVAFYDVKIISSSPLGSNAMAVVSITNPEFSAQDNVMSFWNGSSWITVPSQFITPDTLRGTFFASTLAGTPIMAGTIPELPSILILPLFMVATLLTATIHRKSRRARCGDICHRIQFRFVIPVIQTCFSFLRYCARNKSRAPTIIGEVARVPRGKGLFPWA